MRPPGCRVDEDKPRGAFPLVRGSSGGASKQWRPWGWGWPGTHHPAHLSAQGASFPSCRPAVGCHWLGSCCPPGVGTEDGGVEGGRREGCQGSHPCHFLQISVRLCSVGNPVTELLFLFTEGGARSPGGVRWQRVQTCKRTASGLGTFGKAYGPFDFSISIPSPPHLQASPPSPPFLTLAPPRPFLSSQDSSFTALAKHCAQPPLLCLLPQPYVRVTRGHSTSSRVFKQPSQSWDRS